ncbi:MAG: hypothetical protein IIA82_09140 [Thaumarchaeota archaeon]|nr:hypothetical protein [Nitrososphaerota archaeon]
MKIELREKIRVTESELREVQSVNQQERKSNFPDRLPKKRGRRSIYDPSTNSFEEFMEGTQ